MTVSYTKQFGTVGWCNLFHFARLLTKWRGSFYKLVLPQLLLFGVFYAALLLSYSFVLNEAQRRKFESLISMIARNNDQLGCAVAFFLGFFLDQVLSRFWRQYHLLPWPDGFAFLCAAHLTGRDQRSRLMRRTLVRYVCAATVIGLCEVDPRLRRRFPSFQHYVNADLLTVGEATIAEQVPNGFSKHYVPLSWATALLRRARAEGRIADDHGLAALNQQIDQIRGQLGVLQAYEWVPVPLVYIHVVVLAVYAFFTVTVMTHPFEKWMFTSGSVFSVDGHEVGDQLDDRTRMIMRCVLAVITLLQFCVYAGLLHTSETLLSPFGPHDGDFDTDQLVDRHLRVGYLVVDEMYAVFPQLTSDDNNIDITDSRRTSFAPVGCGLMSQYL